MPEAFKSAKIATGDHARVQEIADSERLHYDYQAISAALDAWDKLSRRKKDQIVAARGLRRRPRSASAA